MKKILSSLLFLFICVTALSQDTFFQYPTPPESIEGFYPRCNYIVEHFWDRCDLKSAFSSRAKMKSAFKDYTSFAVYANKDTLNMSIDNLIKQVAKQPKNLLTLGYIAEECLYSDSAEIYSEELYYPFAKAVALSKKISNAEKARFVRQEKILANSQLGMICPNFSFIMVDDTKANFANYKGVRTVLLFSDPDCDDCRMLFVRLSADFNLKKLIEKGQICFAVITPGTPSDDWKMAVKDLPATWVIGTSEEVEEYFNLDSLPATYYLDAEQKLLSKTIASDRLLELFRTMNTALNQ